MIGSLPLLDEFAVLVHNQIRQEQIAAKQERVQQCTAEQIAHVPVPQIQEQVVENVQVIPPQLFPERIEEQIVDILVPSIVEDMAEVAQIVAQERFQQSAVDQIVVVPVPQVVEEQLVAEETTQTSVEFRTEVEYVAPAPAASFAALDPAVLDGFQQALVGIGASDLDTLTKEQLDAAIKVILRYSKQLKILLERTPRSSATCRRPNSVTSLRCSKPLRGHTKRHVVEVWTVYEMAHPGVQGGIQNTGYRVKTNVDKMIHDLCRGDDLRVHSRDLCRCHDL